MSKEGYAQEIQLEEMETSTEPVIVSPSSSLSTIENDLKKGARIKPISNLETMAHLLKGNIGTGIFALPGAFKNSGLWTGVALLPIMAVICTHCMGILVECGAVMKTRRDDFVLDYADVSEVACETGAKQFRKYGSFFRRLINVFICLTQFGFCCVYVVFISSNLAQVIDHYTNINWDVRIYMCLITIPLIFLNFIRNLKYLAPLALIANVVQAISIFVVFYYVSQDLPSVGSVPAFGSWAGLPLYFGTAVYSFCGISLVLPIQRDMRRPQDFRGWTGILNTGLAITTILYIAVGFFGYLKYGEDIKGSITLNLPSEDVLAEIIQILMVIAISGSYLVQYYVPIPIIWPSLSSSLKLGRLTDAGEYVFRAFMCLVILALAAAIPRVDLFISLVGAVGSSFLALIFPPILEIITYWPDVSVSMMIKDIFIVLFGIFGFATGTYASVLSIVEVFSESGNSTLRS